MIVQCAGVADVITAVKFARAHNVEVAVRSTGHNVAGISVCDDGMVIDLSVMKGIHIDPNARTVRVEPGVTWAELNHELQVFGLAATGGYVGTTGVAGLTLGGGLGWMVRKHGCALDNLLSADVVLADGQLLSASETANSDPFGAFAAEAEISVSNHLFPIPSPLRRNGAGRARVAPAIQGGRGDALLVRF